MSIFVSSKIVHAPRWRALRDAGAPIVARWIDEAAQITACRVMVAYHEPGETPKGSLSEIGAALMANKLVIAVGLDPDIYTVLNHRKVLLYRAEQMDDAMRLAASLKTEAR